MHIKDGFITIFMQNSLRISTEEYSGFSITYSLIEIAVYMGFREIYLIGADCNFTKKEEMHFVEHGVIDTSVDTLRDRNIAGYQLLLNMPNIME